MRTDPGGVEATTRLSSIRPGRRGIFLLHLTSVTRGEVLGEIILIDGEERSYKEVVGV